MSDAPPPPPPPPPLPPGLPNRQGNRVRVNFAIMTFLAVAEICKEFGIRHPEELSLMRSPLDKENYAKFTGWSKRRKVSFGVYGCIVCTFIVCNVSVSVMCTCVALHVHFMSM